MSVQVAHDVLVAAAAVTALVGDRVSPLENKDYTFPAVVLSSVSLAPVNCLSGWAGADNNVVQVDAWARTYAEAKQLQDACRAALDAAGHLLMLGQPDSLQPLVMLSGVQCVSYQYSIWT